MPKVLVVDDRPEGLLDLVKAVRLAADGPDLNLVRAKDKTEALACLAAGPLDLIVTDVALHSAGLDRDGIDVAQAAYKHDPNLPVILVTKYMKPHVAEEGILLDVFDIVDTSRQPLAPVRMLAHKIRVALRFRDALTHAKSA